MIGLLFLALIVFVLYLVHTYHYEKNWKRNFQVNLEFSEEQASVGDQLYLYETAINNKEMKVPVMCIKFETSRYIAFEQRDSGTVSDKFYHNDVLSVDSFQKVRRKLRFTCKKRGLYTIEAAELVSYDLFCTRTFVQKLDMNASLCVYPARIDIEKLLPVFRHMTGGIATRVPLFEDPYAFAGVREYTPQDSMRRIHWKASARTGEWQVRTTEYHASTPVVVLVNLESPGVFTNTDLMEDSIRLAYSFVYYLGVNGMTTRLVVNADEKICLEGSGRNHMSAVRYSLATVSYNHVEKNGVELIEREKRYFRPDTHVIFISPAGKKPLQEAVAEVMNSGIAITWVAPIISSNGEDSEFREVPEKLQKCIVKWGGV